MTNQSVCPGLRSCIDAVIEKRSAWLGRLIAGQSMLNITVHNTGKKILCVYKRHDKASITIESTKEILDWILRDEPFVVFSGNHQYTPKEATFNLVDVEIAMG